MEEDLPAQQFRSATDPGRLLTGEEPETTRLSDVIHWMRVYQELLDFKEDLITTAEAHAAALDDPAATEIRTTDLVLLKAEKERFASRLEFWTRRGREMDAAPADEPSGC